MDQPIPCRACAAPAAGWLRRTVALCAACAGQARTSIEFSPVHTAIVVSAPGGYRGRLTLAVGLPRDLRAWQAECERVDVRLAAIGAGRAAFDDAPPAPARRPAPVGGWGAGSPR